MSADVDILFLSDSEVNMYSVFLFIQFISICVAFWGLVMVLHEKGEVNYNNKMLITIVCACVYCVGYMLELESTTMEGALVATKVEYMGLPFATYFFALFVAEYCRIKVPRFIKAVFIAYNVLLIFCVLQCSWVHLYYKSISFSEDGLYPHLVIERGPLYYCQILVIIAVFTAVFIITLNALINERDVKRRKPIVLLFSACLIPMISYVMFLTNTTGGYEPVSIGMLLAILIIVYCVKKYQIFDLEGIAHKYIIEEMEEALVVVDADYRYLSANPAAVRLWEQLGNRPDDEEKIQESLINIFTDKESLISLQGRFYRKHISPIYSKKKLAGYSALVLDITESRRQMQKLEELKEEADAANQAKSAFLANISHEIRTPMNAIVGYSELILRESHDKSISRHAGDIKVASGNLLSIINSVLDISKIESGKMEIVDTQYELKELLQDVVNVVNIPILNKKLRFYIKVDESLPSVFYGDSIRIRQVLVNILNNAIKFTRTGSILMSVQGESRTGQVQRLKWKISDTGTGIREEDLEKVFGRFEQTDQYRNYGVEGTGLGLAISKSLVAAMGGRITVDSIYGRGSTFTIHLKQRVVEEVPVGRVSLDELTQRTVKSDKIPFIAPLAQILVVDDNQINLDVTHKYLRQFKIQADMTDNGLDAINMIQDKKYHIVFMDQMMPGIDGIETVRRIRKLEKEGRKRNCIIALTANAIDGTREFMLANGFNDYISKPMDLGKLERLLRKYLPPDCIEYYEMDQAYTETEEEDKDILIPGIREEEGLAHCQNNRQQYLEILEAVKKYGPSQAEEIERCMREKDYERYVIEVHGLKSNALNIGAMDLSQKAAELEQAGKEGRIEQIEEEAPGLLKDFRKLLEDLEIFFKKEEIDTEIEEDLNGSRETISKILNAMERGDYEEAAEQLELLGIFSLEESLTKETEELKELFAKKDYDMVRSRLEHLTD